MDQVITFVLSNFPLTFGLLGLIVAGFEILRTPVPRTPGSEAGFFLLWKTRAGKAF